MEETLLRKSEFPVNPKQKVALASFLIALVLTLFKAIVGFSTGSLGILSEALHSSMDLIATGITFFAVRISDKPADEGHNYGHGKIDNISALFATFLLIITCGWIIYEALERLLRGNFAFLINFWSFVVIIFSIIVDINRAIILYKTSKKHKSQALEADALHFSSDVLSSVVVLLGLIFSSFNIHLADTIAALIVSGIILVMAWKLARRAVFELIDSAPKCSKQTIERIISEIPEVVIAHDIKVRSSGENVFIDLNIHLDPKISIEEAHKISHLVETKIKQKVENSIVHIHQEPATEH